VVPSLVRVCGGLLADAGSAVCRLSFVAPIPHTGRCRNRARSQGSREFVPNQELVYLTDRLNFGTEVV